MARLSSQRGRARTYPPVACTCVRLCVHAGYVTKDEQMKVGLLALLASLLVVGFGKYLVRGKPAAGFKAD